MRRRRRADGATGIEAEGESATLICFVGAPRGSLLPPTHIRPGCSAYPHSVVTQHLIDAAGQPTIAARDEVSAFFATRLATGP
jgi:hypothetical protein